MIIGYVVCDCYTEPCQIIIHKKLLQTYKTEIMKMTKKTTVWVINPENTEDLAKTSALKVYGCEKNTNTFVMPGFLN